jgi:hypothetical protein
MSYSESRNHFEKARSNSADAVTNEMLDGLKHLSHAIEEDIRRVEQEIRNIQESADTASKKLEQEIRNIQESTSRPGWSSL